MPLSINVGLSRKASVDYQSTGFSINVVAELDQALLARPDDLQRQIDGLYAQAESAIERRVRAHETNRGASRQSHGRDERAFPNTRSRGGRAATMTNSQRRAIRAIGERLGLDIETECREAVRMQFEDLSIRDASRFIDHLKGLERPISDGGNGQAASAAGEPSRRNGGAR